jgi:hypothetical protein
LRWVESKWLPAGLDFPTFCKPAGLAESKIALRFLHARSLIQGADERLEARANAFYIDVLPGLGRGNEWQLRWKTG